MNNTNLVRFIAMAISPRNPNGYVANRIADDLDLGRKNVREILTENPALFDVWYNQHIMMVKLNSEAYAILGWNKPEPLQY